MNAKEIEKERCREYLAKLLKPGDRIFCVLRHVSKSGMSRRIDFFKALEPIPYCLTHSIATLLDYRLDHQKEGMIVRGCGMDMGFSVVYELGRTLWPKGFKIPKGSYGRNGDTSGFDTDGGYALKSYWL